MYLGSRGVQETAYGEVTKDSWGPYRRNKGVIHCIFTIWYTNLGPCLKRWKYLQHKQQWIKNEKKLENISAWNLAKVRNKSEVIDEAWNKSEKVHFASLMDICHLKNTELEKKHQKYKGRVVLRGDIVRDDSGSYAVFTEQPSSASQVTAAEVMDINSRLPGLVVQAADAISQVKMEDAPQLLNIQKSNYPDIWTRLPRHKWPKSLSSMEDPVVPLERNLYGHPLAGLLWEEQFEKIMLEHGWGKFQLRMLIRTPWKRIILICVRAWQQIGWKERKYQSHVKSTRQRSRCGRTNIIPWSCLLGMYSKTFRNKRTFLTITEPCSNPEFPQEQLKILPSSGTPNIPTWTHDTEGHAKKCVERYCELANNYWTIMQSTNSMHWWPSNERRSIEIRGRSVRSMFQKLFWNVLMWLTYIHSAGTSNISGRICVMRSWKTTWCADVSTAVMENCGSTLCGMFW